MAFINFFAAVDALRRSYSLPAGEQPVATASRAILDASGNVILAADALPGTLSASVELVSASTPLTGASLTVNALGKNESVMAAPAGTIAALTVVFPTDAASVIGQEIRISSTQTVTALTLTTAGLTILGTAVTALTANVPVAFKKINAAVFMRTN